MNVVEEILADMALNAPPPDEALPCGFMRLPLELRKRIYALLLLPAPVTRVHCSIGHYTKQCSPGGRFLASTCKPRATVTHTIGCGTCEWRGGDTHTAILSTNKTIYAEASDVLYENSQALFFRDGPLQIFPPLSNNIRTKIRKFVFALAANDKGFFHLNAFMIRTPPNFSDIKVVELHFDIDLTKTTHIPVNDTTFGGLVLFAHAEMVIDVHIICAWDEDVVGLSDGWNEPVSRRVNVSERRALDLDERAFEMRRQFVEKLGELFHDRGKTLVVREN